MTNTLYAGAIHSAFAARGSAEAVAGGPLLTGCVPVAPEVALPERDDDDVPRPGADLLVAARAHVLLAGLVRLHALQL